MAKLLLSGYYGFGNLGDEAILASTVEAIGRRAPGVDISVLSANPSETSVSHGIKAFNRMSPGGVVSAIRASDLVVFGGGSLLQDATSFRSLSYYIAFIYLTKVLGKPLVVYANGIGPLRSALGKRLTRAALLTAREITLRDPESESVLRQLGVGIDAKVTVTADPAFLLTPAPPTRTREILASHGLDQERDIVWLALRGGQEDGFYRAVAEAVTLLRSEGSARPARHARTGRAGLGSGREKHIVSRRKAGAAREGYPARRSPGTTGERRVLLRYEAAHSSCRPTRSPLPGR